MRYSRGFTLIEILVTMAIIGVLATSVALTLPDSNAEQRRKDMQALRRQAESAALRAEAEAVPWAWKIDNEGARLLRYSGTQWVAASDRIGIFHALPEGMTISRLEIDGKAQALGSRIVFSEAPPLFIVDMAGGGRFWRFSGQPGGAILLEENP